MLFQALLFHWIDAYPPDLRRQLIQRGGGGGANIRVNITKGRAQQIAVALR